ncbi:hypothetical protein ACFPT7_23545 [Acidicapsa dinghuensis]|uniref:Uncharacterized protein n=1 Tax=Acidicapsa dinghuensis TaxID=2218256 RepID=A0ABW1EPP7_9BACT|nr:hypothetical protein [Acidicapsa dinghuensis]
MLIAMSNQIEGIEPLVQAVPRRQRLVIAALAFVAASVFWSVEATESSVAMAIWACFFVIYVEELFFPKLAAKYRAITVARAVCAGVAFASFLWEAVFFHWKLAR